MKIKKLLANYKEFDGKEIVLEGWVRNHRVGKNISFISLNDGSAFESVQIVYKDLSNKKEVDKVYIGGAVEITGTLKVTPDGKQDFEIVASQVKVLQASSEKYPLQPKKHSYEFMREIAHLRPRTNTFNAVFRIRSLLSFAVHEFFNQNGFVYVHTPIITSADAEGAGEMFQVTTLNLDDVPKNTEEDVDYKKDFFGKSVNLTVSGQLLAESYALAFGDVYTFGPTFRAEHSNTTRHAAEFWMIEPEMAFTDLDGDIKMAKGLLIHVVAYVLKNAKSELKFLDGLVEYDLIKRLENLVASDFFEIDYEEAIKQLQAAVAEGITFEHPVEYGVDLATEHERYLTEFVYNAPIFVKNYPKEIKAFYMKLNDDGRTVAAMDLLVPGIGELIGGSERENDLEKLESMMKTHDLSKEDYAWYLELRKFGGVTHSGFGVGFERLVMYVTGMENIRDVIPFPRTTKNSEF